jgi:2-polyprenyl-3-methyl-5-hydroxy-6-metoxy-1,4-benzoquinol methylase
MTNKDKVYQSYDKMFKWFDEARSRELFEKPYLDLAVSYLKPKAKILDLGCGMGEPIGKYFIDQGFDLTGIDGSVELINLAKSRFPEAKFMVQDMREINLNEKFDLVIAWHSLFHLSQDEQKSMFQIFESLINREGILLFTTGHENGEVWSDNGGERLYHASLDPEEYKKLLTEYHFEIIKYKLNDEKCGGACVWVARYAKVE